MISFFSSKVFFISGYYIQYAANLVYSLGLIKVTYIPVFIQQSGDETDFQYSITFESRILKSYLERHRSQIYNIQSLRWVTIPYRWNRIQGMWKCIHNHLSSRMHTNSKTCTQRNFSYLWTRDRFDNFDNLLFNTVRKAAALCYMTICNPLLHKFCWYHVRFRVKQQYFGTLLNWKPKQVS